MNDTYLGNPNVKRDGIVQNWTEHEVQEYAKCMNNPAYFASKYCKIISLDLGLVPFELYPYQEKMFSHFNNNRFNIVLACRQSGKSISSVVYLLWFAIFNPEKTNTYFSLLILVISILLIFILFSYYFAVLSHFQ